MTWPKNIVLLGAGNVAWHLGKHMVACGCPISHVYARREAQATALAEILNCESSTQLKDVPAKADIYLLAVSDTAIATLAEELAHYINTDRLVLHTSGATPASVFSPHFERYGVFYPLQTFSKKRTLDFSTVPLCICTHKKNDYEWLQQLAKRLVHDVYAVSDEQRLRLHLAAVFVNNFTNYLQHISHSLLEEQQLPTQLLQPLLHETVAKLHDLPPKEAQTGPAIRGDEATLLQHLIQLNEHPHWQDIYRLLSKGIKREL